LQLLTLIYYNRAGYSRAHITRNNNTIKVRVELSRPLNIKAGQYICLWIPSVSSWSFLQSHPFTVTSWSDGKQSNLDLFIEPRGGLTRELLQYSGSSFPALICGPHGKSAPIGNFETVLMVASGFGIAAQLPYLKQLVYGYKARPRRVHLVWEIENAGKP
jgi:NAD(P)H-flavin reductase